MAVRKPLKYSSQEMMLTWTVVVGAQMDRSGRLGFTVEDDVTRSVGGMEKESEAKMLTPRILA